MSKETSTPQTKWKPAGNPSAAPENSETVDPAARARARATSKGAIRGEVSNFDSRPAEYSKDTSWVTWNFILQLYDEAGQKTESYSVRMKYVASGQLVNGHHVEVRGKFKSGVFVASRISDLDTGAAFEPAVNETTRWVVRRLLMLVAITFFCVILVEMFSVWRHRPVLTGQSGESGQSRQPGQPGQPGQPIQPDFPGSTMTAAVYDQLVSKVKAQYDREIEHCTKPGVNVAQCQQSARRLLDTGLRQLYVSRYGKQPPA